MYSAGKQRYYAAIVQEAAARRAFDENPSQEGVLDMDPNVYEDIGKKSLAAFTNLLDALSGTRSTSLTPKDGVALESQLASLVQAIEVIRRDLTAFVSRTDRMLLELSRRLDAAEHHGTEHTTNVVPMAGDGGERLAAAAAAGATGPATVVPVQGRRRGAYQRVPKEQTLQRILDAARELSALGRRVTLAECARHADVAYYKAVYACKDSDELADIMGGGAV